VVGAFIATYRTRRFLSRLPTAFRCTLHVADVRRHWWQRSRGRTGWGVWLHDSLVIASGALRVRVSLIPVHFVEGTVDEAVAQRRFGRSRELVQLSLQLDDGTDAVLTARRSAASLVAGPYLVARLARH
jgi:hypothetical protein